jgi:hypothetical protein
MNNKRTIVLVTVGALSLVILLMAATGAWAGPGERGPAAALAPAGVVSDTISYQGRLLDSSGNAVAGTRTMDFRLYADASGGTPLWSQSGSVTLEDGLFNVNLTVDPAHFDGRSLWLGVQVQGDAQEMTPRQPLLPVPYALSLRPGAGISGTVGGAPTLNIVSDGIGVQAETSSTDSKDAAVLAQNHGSGHGVAGYSTDEAAVYGQSVDGLGGYFTSTNDSGVHAFTLSGDPNAPAIHGGNLGNGKGVEGVSDMGIGVYGQSVDRAGVEGQSVDGFGVLGDSVNGPGVFGQGITGTAGVFTSTYGYGVVVEGAGLDGLRIFDRVGGDYISAGSDADLDFRVDNAGTVYADGGYNCGLGPGAEPGTCVIQNSPADFAEMLPSDDGLEPGDVLVVDPDSRLTRSTQPYQPSVVGVYSTQPGYLGGGEHRGQNGYAPLAVVGIVPVKASAENGPIAPGDLLVASATPGHAMKAGPNPPVGTVIGKALEGLDVTQGTDFIMMLAMLQ